MQWQRTWTWYNVLILQIGTFSLYFVCKLTHNGNGMKHDGSTAEDRVVPPAWYIGYSSSGCTRHCARAGGALASSRYSIKIQLGAQ